MKTTKFTKGLLAIASALLVQGGAALAQDSVTTTSTVSSDGVVQTFDPAASAFTVTSSTATAPVHYTFSKTTTFVDANGNTVSYDTIKQNTPARIYYTKVGDAYVVTKFVVNPTVQTVQTVAPAPTPVVEETTTTTTTTSGK